MTDRRWSQGSRLRGQMFLAACCVFCVMAGSQIVLVLDADSSGRMLGVVVEYPGVGAREIERRITVVLENAFAQLPGVHELTSRSSNGRAEVHVEYRPDHDPEQAYLEFREALNASEASLPSGAQTPRVQRNARAGELPTYIVAFPETLLDSVDTDTLRTFYQAVPGVGRVDVGGREATEIVVAFHPTLSGADLEAPGALAVEVLRSASLQHAHRIAGGSYLVLNAGFSSPTEVRNSAADRIHSVGNLFHVITRPADTRRITRVNQEPAVVVYVGAEHDADRVRLSRRLDAVSRSIDVRYLSSNAHNPGSEELLNTQVLYDQADGVVEVLRELGLQLVLAAVAVVAMVAILLRRSTACASIAPAPLLAVALPPSVLASLGRPIDTAVFGAMILGAGLSTGAAALVYVYEADRSTQSGYRRALVFSLISIAIVFLPLPYSSEELKRSYSSFAAALLIGLGAVGFYCIRIQPGLLPAQRAVAMKCDGGLIRHVVALLCRLEHIVRGRPGVRIAALTLPCILAGFGLVGTQIRLNSAPDARVLSAFVEFPAGTTITVVADRARTYEAMAASLVGNQALILSGIEEARLRLDFVRYDRRPFTPAAIHLLEQQLSHIQSTEETLHFMDGGSGRNPYSVDIFGPDLQRLREVAIDLAARIQRLTSVHSVLFRFRDDAEILELQPQAAALYAAGLPTQGVASQLYHAFGSGVSAKWYPPEGERDIRVEAVTKPETLPSLLSFPVMLPNGGQVSVGNITELQQQSGDGARHRRNRVPTLGMNVYMEHGDGNGLEQHFHDTVHELHLENGYFIELTPPHTAPDLPLGAAGALLVLVVCVSTAACNSAKAGIQALAPIPACLLTCLALSATLNGELRSEAILGALVGAGIVVQFTLLRMMNRGETRELVYRAVVVGSLCIIAMLTAPIVGLGGNLPLRDIALGPAMTSILSLFLLPIWASGLREEPLRTQCALNTGGTG